MHSTTPLTRLHRRHFLGLAGAMAAAATQSAFAQTAADYKALVCVFLAGGNDGHNLLVPRQPQAYAEYVRLRGALALPTSALLTLSTAEGVPYGLHGQMSALAPQWTAGRLAVVANVGALAAPTTRQQVLNGSVTLPPNLFSHSDQIQLAQAGHVQASGTGWGGRCADAVAPLNGDSRFPAAVSLAGGALYNQGLNVPSASLIPGFDLTPSGMSAWPASAATARAQALSEVLAIDQGVRLVQAANQVRSDALGLHQLLRSGSGQTLTTPFPGTEIGRQLQQVARTIALRQSTGVRRQVFYAQLGGFDTHSGQAWMQGDLLRQLAEALAAFHAAMQELGTAQSVTTFTQSEFGRTLQPSGTGSDHGWGNHHLLLGGAVRGGRVHGQFPFPALAGPDDANARGVLIPTMSLEQFAAPLALWFGVPSSALPAVFPSLSLFSAPPNLMQSG